jgi:hypothetical protein
MAPPASRILAFGKSGSSGLSRGSLKATLNPVKVVVGMQHPPTTCCVIAETIKKSADDYLFCFQ